MYENENDAVKHTDDQTSQSSNTNAGYTGTGSTYSSVQNTGYTGQTSYTGNSSQTTGSYSAQNSSYNQTGSYNGATGSYQGAGTTHTGTTGSYSQTGSSQGNYSQTYNQGNYTSYNANNYNNSNTGNYSNPNGTTYGSYQYGSYSGMPQGNGGNGPKKGGAGKVIAIAVAAVAVVALLAGGVYYSYSRITRAGKLIASNDDKQTEETTQNEDVASAEDSTSAEDNTSEEAVGSNSSDGIAKTETMEKDHTVVTDVTEVVAAAMPAMVSINNNFTESYNYFGQNYSQEQTASGSGFIVGTNDTELLIATNYHVIEGADSLEVTFVDESTASAEVKGTDSNMDLAVIAVQLTALTDDTKGAIAVATLGDSDSLVLGEPAIAIGNALGYGQSVTTGVISAVNRVIDLSDSKQGTFIQTSAAINPGNSGGALLNISGEVIGINSNKIGGEAIEGMGYAIPISTAKPIIEKLMTEKTRSKVSDEERGYLGVSIVSVTSEVSEMYGLPLGVYVAGVSADGGAQAAGIQEGDIITKFDGNEISSKDDLQNRLAYYTVGETVTITVMRQSDNGYQEHDVEVTLGSKQTVQSAEENSSDTYEGEPNEDAKQEEGQDQQQGFYDPFSDDNGFGFPFGFGN
ncbi:S1C family serine protease [Butyrivibrio sp. NC2002]|uniref:S1C family serine protease n=1 Tax=Butyrivibrio sp. NC2002 TaxID=1410610 RepID=UPI00068C6E87|nr:trypsin-like peptidase domain-containing protein [Butyrivibrio sp. NC2002]